MSTLWIYIDESGDIPLEDESGPFVVASVSILGDPPSIVNKEGRVDWLIQKIKEIKALPFIVEIKPFPGFGTRIKGKMDKFNTMALGKKLTTGSHKYLSSYKYVQRNILWTWCVVQTAVSATTYYILRENVSIERINIIVDEKSLARGIQALLKDAIKRMPENLNNVLDEMHRTYGEKVSKVIGDVQFKEADVQISFGRAESNDEKTDGLYLSHYLASLYRKQVLKNRKLTIKERLEELGHVNFINDRTDMILKPISNKTIWRWCQDTGLLEPQEY